MWSTVCWQLSLTASIKVYNYTVSINVIRPSGSAFAHLGHHEPWTHYRHSLTLINTQKRHLPIFLLPTHHLSKVTVHCIPFSGTDNRRLKKSPKQYVHMQYCNCIHFTWHLQNNQSSIQKLREFLKSSTSMKTTEFNENIDIVYFKVWLLDHSKCTYTGGLCELNTKLWSHKSCSYSTPMCWPAPWNSSTTVRKQVNLFLM